MDDLLDGSQFNYNFRYKSGMGNVDTLSCIPQSYASMEASPSPASDDQTIATIQKSTWTLRDLRRIKEAQHKDSYLATVIKAVDHELGEPPPGLTRQRNKIVLKGGVLCCRFKESSGTPAMT